MMLDWTCVGGRGASRCRRVCPAGPTRSLIRRCRISARHTALARASSHISEYKLDLGFAFTMRTNRTPLPPSSRSFSLARRSHRRTTRTDIAAAVYPQAPTRTVYQAARNNPLHRTQPSPVHNSTHRQSLRETRESKPVNRAATAPECLKIVMPPRLFSRGHTTRTEIHDVDRTRPQIHEPPIAIRNFKKSFFAQSNLFQFNAPHSNLDFVFNFAFNLKPTNSDSKQIISNYHIYFRTLLFQL